MIGKKNERKRKVELPTTNELEFLINDLKLSKLGEENMAKYCTIQEKIQEIEDINKASIEKSQF